MQQIRRNANQAGLGPPVYSGSIAQQIQQNQNYAGLPYTPRAMGGPMDFGDSGVFNAAPGDWNSYNAAVEKMRKDSELKATGNMPSKFGPKPLTMAFIPFGGSAPQRGGGGGGGGGRMGPPSDKKISTLGPRTTTDYVNKHGGLSPQRPSMLDAEYAKGNLTNPRVTDWMNNQPPAAAPGGPAPTQMMAGAGAAVGGAVGGMVNDAMPDQKALTPMAKGGAMHPGKKPYLVGEEGPELIFPRADGSGFVLPHDVSKQVLPMLPKGGTKPRAVGGPMELRTPSARFAGMTGPSGTGFAMTQTPSQQAMPMTMQDAGLAMLPGDRMIADDGFAVDLPALAAGGNESMPMMPDVVSGPWASPAMPVDSRQIGPNVQNQFSRLMAEGAMPASPYDGLMVPDQRISASGRDRLLTAQGSLEAPQMVPFAEMQERMAVRGIEASNRSFDARQADVDRQLAARAARAPLGTPVLPPTTPGGLPMIPGMERNIERFLRTPQGAMFALEQGTEDARMQQRIQAAATAIPVRDQQTGEVRGYVSGTGASLPTPGLNGGRQIRRQQMVEGQMYNFFDDGTAEPVNIAIAGTDKIQAWDTGNARMVELPADTDVTKLPPGLTLLPRTGTAPAAKTDTAKTDAAKPASAVVRVNTVAEAKALPPGTMFMTPQGNVKMR